MVIRNMAVQTLVMINPTGKIPNFRPGMTKPESVVVPPLELAASELEANIPLTNDVPLAERFAIRGVPSPLVAESAMVGVSNERVESLSHSQYGILVGNIRGCEAASYSV